MAYFYLANLYGQAYNEAQPVICVLLVLEPDITIVSPSRATISQIWGQMTSDIENAIKNLKDKSTGDYFTIGYDAVLALATRIYLFMEDWDNAITYGEELVGRKPELQDITSETKATSSTYGSTDKAVINFSCG